MAPGAVRDVNRRCLGAGLRLSDADPRLGASPGRMSISPGLKRVKSVASTAILHNHVIPAATPTVMPATPAVIPAPTPRHPPTPTAIPATPAAIPAPPIVIPAKAGIHRAGSRPPFPSPTPHSRAHTHPILPTPTPAATPQPPPPPHGRRASDRQRPPATASDRSRLSAPGWVEYDPSSAPNRRGGNEYPAEETKEEEA